MTDPHAGQPDTARTGQQDSVQRQPDGTTIYTHGHRYPDNVQIVEQRHRADGTLQSARVTWSGFAGQVLDVTATFGPQGQLIREDGYRAQGMTTPVSDLIRPLPAPAAAGAATPATPQTPAAPTPPTRTPPTPTPTAPTPAAPTPAAPTPAAPTPAVPTPTAPTPAPPATPATPVHPPTLPAAQPDTRAGERRHEAATDPTADGPGSDGPGSDGPGSEAT